MPPTAGRSGGFPLAPRQKTRDEEPTDETQEIIRYAMRLNINERLGVAIGCSKNFRACEVCIPALTVVPAPDIALYSGRRIHLPSNIGQDRIYNYLGL